MTAYLIANLGYALALVCHLAALLLVLEWFVHLLPGAGLNWFRRALFLATFPFLKFSDRFFTLKSGSFDARGLLTAILLVVIGHYGAPLMVLFGYSLRG